MRYIATELRCYGVAPGKKFSLKLTPKQCFVYKRTDESKWYCFVKVGHSNNIPGYCVTAPFKDIYFVSCEGTNYSVKSKYINSLARSKNNILNTLILNTIHNIYL